MPRTPDVTLAFQVKGYDIDVGGVVHNSVYLLWLDDVRTAFLEKVQSIEEQLKLGYIPVLSKTEISYKRAAKFGDRPVGHMHLDHLSKLRWRISCEFVVDGIVTTQAIQEGCLIDLESGRPVPVPEPFSRYWHQKKEQEEAPERQRQLQLGSKSNAASIRNMDNFDPTEAMVCPV
jgi:YbgC/YbaW family acyl-CoA thioester hydrolase